jgi:Family of unknown function (DUF5522)
MTRRRRPVEGVDYYVEGGGRLVFTEAYHLARGYCCKGRCRHCPWRESRDVAQGEAAAADEAPGKS